MSIKTPAGVILHTGDWKVDPNPLIGDKVDEKKLKLIGDAGVIAMICDSTNVFSPGRAGSENDVRESLLKIISSQKKSPSNIICIKCSQDGKYLLYSKENK